MSNKTVGYIFLIIVVVIVLAACNAGGDKGEQPTAPEGNTAESSDVAFDLKPDGCDFVCVASAWLSDNAHPIDSVAEAD